jgi:aminoglycoside/choline kinase family phosphotransferase
LASSITLVAREAGRVGWDRFRPGSGALPAGGDALTPSFIERAASWPAGAIRSVEVLDEHHGTAGRVRAALDRSSRAPAEIPGTVFVKLTPRSLVQRLMMNLYDLASREVLFYSSIASDAPVRTPECHSAVIDPRRGRNVMLLEDLDGKAEFRDIRDPVTIEEAGRVLDALADLHAAFWESPRFAADMAPLRSRKPAAERIGNMFVDRVLARPKGSPAEVIPADVAAHARRVVARRPEIDALWRRQPQSLCHGDTHLGNLFFEGDTPGFLDWQATLMAPSLRDVSYFLVSSVDPADLAGAERGLVDRYAERLAANGIGIERGRAWETYRAIAVEIYVAAVVTAGTSDRMQPPEISKVGVVRVNEAVQRLDTFGVLEKMLDDAPGAG